MHDDVQSVGSQGRGREERLLGFAAVFSTKRKYIHTHEKKRLHF